MEQSSIKGRSLINEKLAKLNSFKELIFFFLKYSFSFTKIIGSFFIILIIFFGTIAEVPYYFAFSLTQNVSLFIISAIIYGSIFYIFRKSTIFENILATKLGKKEIYGAIFITMFIFTGLMYLFIIMIYVTLIQTGSPLLMRDWFFASTPYGEGGLSIAELNWQLIFWWFFAFCFLNFGLFYLFQNISNNKKTFYLFVFLYVLLLIIYGNTAVPPTPYVDNYSWLNNPEQIDHLNYLLQKFNISKSNLEALFNYFHLSGNIVVNKTFILEFKNGKYLASFFHLLLPHSWINIFSAAIWESTIFKVEFIDFLIIGNYPVHIDKDIYLAYPVYPFKNAPIWKIKGQIWWALGMYLWIFYFGLLYLFGTIFSRIKKL